MRFQCPQCHEIVTIDKEDLGAQIQCGNCMNVIKVPAERVAPGVVVGDFLILEKIGHGGMGIVYRAHQLSLDRPAAVKILSTAYSSNPDFITGFIKEARAAAQLNHPHIVQAFAVGDDDGLYYFAMEYINGETMKTILRREGYLDVNAVLNIIQQIAEALDYAWKEAKLVHRDIKPDNIMMTSNGRAKLADLGLARKGDDVSEDAGEEVIGTPQYISPEQLTGTPVDTRSDIYSLGATFYHLITGRFPFEGSTALEIAQKHLTDELVPPHKLWSSIPENVSLVICKMMAKNVKDRYQTPAELIEDLLMIRRGKLPPGVAALHGGGFAGKTLVLVNNTSSHPRIPAMDAPAPKHTLKLVLILSLIGIAAVAAGLVLFFTLKGDNKDQPVVNLPPTFIMQANALIQKSNLATSAEEKTALHREILALRAQYPALDTPEDLKKMDELSIVFAILDEALVITPSNIRKEGAQAQLQARKNARP